MWRAHAPSVDNRNASTHLSVTTGDRDTAQSGATVPTVFDPACSARHALELIASKWTMLVLSALAEGPMRNGALLRKVGGVSQKMLTQTVPDLELFADAIEASFAEIATAAGVELN